MITTYGRDFATANTEFQRIGATTTGRQSQVVAAHRPGLADGRRAREPDAPADPGTGDGAGVSFARRRLSGELAGPAEPGPRHLPDNDYTNHTDDWDPMKAESNPPGTGFRSTRRWRFFTIRSRCRGRTKTMARMRNRRLRWAGAASWPASAISGAFASPPPLRGRDRVGGRAMPKSLTPLARTLRRNATRAERRLWQGPPTGAGRRLPVPPPGHSRPPHRRLRLP